MTTFKVLASYWKYHDVHECMWNIYGGYTSHILYSCMYIAIILRLLIPIAYIILHVVIMHVASIAYSWSLKYIA